MRSSLLLSRNLSRNRTRHSFASSVARMLLLSCIRPLRSGLGLGLKTSCQTRHSFTNCVLHSSLLLSRNLSRNRTRHSLTKDMRNCSPSPALHNARTEVRICIARREHCALHSLLLLSHNLSRNRAPLSFARSVAFLRSSRNLSRNRTRHSLARSVAGVLLLS